MKKVLWSLGVVVLMALVYYVFIRSYEFEVNFKAKTIPGDLIETIRIWDRSLDSVKIIQVDSFSGLKQAIVWEGKSYHYDWQFTRVNDSLTEVSIHISEPGNRIGNKLLVPFTEQPIEKDAADIANKFYKILKAHLEITSVQVMGEVELDSSFCACSKLETKQIDKANGMMLDYPLLTSFIDSHKLKINGPPMVRVSEWNHTLGLLKFDFCFPVVFTDSLPVVKSITYKHFARQKALKAEYHGNYITSDRAWYELLQYAASKGYEINGLPIEYFHNNPNLGMNESEWKADVYLPIRN